MLDELTLSHAESDDGPALKRRRVGGRLVVQGSVDEAPGSVEIPPDTASVASVPEPVQQTAYTDSEDSKDSDDDWEDVDLGGSTDVDIQPDEAEVSDEPRELSLVLGDKKPDHKARAAPRRKPVTAEERTLRLEVHKLNILCLMSHVHRRNHWCNDDEVQSTLRSLLSEKTLSYLDENESRSQFDRNRLFMEGLKQACDTFKQSFTIDARGMARCFWSEDVGNIPDMDVPDDIDLPVQRPDFRQVCHELRASRDIGAQLFCALLRSAGVDTRLVCSLQPLPLTATAKGNTPVKPRPAMTFACQETRTGMDSEGYIPDHRSNQSLRTAKNDDEGARVSAIRSKFAAKVGRAPSSITPNTSTTAAPKVSKPKKKKRIRESPYPVYWIEAFNAAYQKWVPVDPLVTMTIGKPSKLEPPASDLQNNLAYVIAFEEDGSARDATRRYTSAYNAKTRKSRVESTKDGVKWWKRVMRMYKRLYHLDRDQVEDAELNKKEVQEPMPKNVQDFKNHPYYALERHVKRNEVIHPRREVGKVSTGKGGLDSDQAVEPIYRRRDVHVVKSADSWYRIGREIKVGEQPLKRVQPRKRKMVTSDDEASGEEENAGTPMYAGFQTCPYQAPPVVQGRVPRNEYGNLDVYVAGMVPPGGAHTPHRDTARAARLLGLDYADAVIGFEFKGRHGTAVIKGAVVAAEYVEAIVEVLRGYHNERTQLEFRLRSVNALRLWKRFMAGLRIRERIQGYASEGDQGEVQDELDDIQEAERGDAGGFLPDREQEASDASIIQYKSNKSGELSAPNYEALRESILENVAVESNGEFVEPQILFGPPLETSKAHNIPQNVKCEEGGFLPDDNEGAFMLEEAEGGFMLGQEDSVGHQALSDHETVEGSRHDMNPKGFQDEKRIDQLFESQGGDDDSEQAPEIVMKGLSDSEQTDLEKEDPGEGRGSHNESHNPAQLKREESDLSDKGSLLSHDPEDDDAEPEWLV
ncbi:MAG: hypothetical protein MMC23_002430 [Stictis urceolatum]|nr:hypothetical protein [Stictis urceolata]